MTLRYNPCPCEYFHFERIGKQKFILKFRYPYSHTMRDLATELDQDRAIRQMSEAPLPSSYANEVSPLLRVRRKKNLRCVVSNNPVVIV